MKTKPMSSLATSSASVAAERKAALKRLIDAGRLDEIPEYQAQSALSDEDRQVLGRIHPAFMGGEYLPDLPENEVAIARLTIASTTQDVTSVYARRGKNRIRYRVVDEYDGDTLSGRNTRSSIRPLTLGEARLRTPRILPDKPALPRRAD